jgi:hypothetical protein
MFCKVCKDARKGEKEYTSHNVKDGKGAVVCPTLLNQACGYCKEKGHTVKFCSVLLKKNVEETRDARLEARQEAYRRKLDVVVEPKPKPLHNNTFSLAFESDSDSEEEEEEEEVIDMILKVPIVTTYIRSYMSVLSTQIRPSSVVAGDGDAQTKEGVVVRGCEEVKIFQNCGRLSTQKVEPKVEPKVYKSHVKGSSWADDDSSDSDEE